MTAKLKDKLGLKTAIARKGHTQESFSYEIDQCKNFISSVFRTGQTKPASAIKICDALEKNLDDYFELTEQ